MHERSNTDFGPMVGLPSAMAAVIALTVLINQTPAPTIPGDLNGDGMIDLTDLLILLNNWGPCAPPPADCPADLDESGEVDLADLLILLGNWS